LEIAKIEISVRFAKSFLRLIKRVVNVVRVANVKEVKTSNNYNLSNSYNLFQQLQPTENYTRLTHPALRISTFVYDRGIG
jgi:hypothetical protein